MYYKYVAERGFLMLNLEGRVRLAAAASGCVLTNLVASSSENYSSYVDTIAVSLLIALLFCLSTHLLPTYALFGLKLS